MSHTSVKIYISSPYGVSIGDIQAVLGSSRNDIGGLITTGRINKWAKWKPVRSTALDLDTEDSRRGAGRATPNDYSRQYGVHASGVSNIMTFSGIHECQFEYERPEDGYGYKYRFFDFVHPDTPNLYGYRADARCDLAGAIYPLTGRILVPPHDIGMELEINYSPLTTAEANEMISIKDFLTNEASGGITIDPLTCYPCALITQNGYHYIRGLYKSNGSAIATLGSTGSTMWRLDTTTAPNWTENDYATMSLFLCSQQIILHGSPNLDIANWITIQEESSAEDLEAWEAWFCPVPDATGKSVYIGSTPPATNIQIVSAEYSQDRSKLIVTWAINGTVQPGGTYTITAEMGGDMPTKSLSLRPSTTGGTTEFTLSTDFPNTLFIRGAVNTYQVTTQNEGTTPPTLIDSEQFTLTY